ncbi:MAG: hypothetical protein HGB12_02615 [Bacteroidetes bacterium]|nr:hypothetical protein [Bacteroidota bacterium]
MRIFISVSNDPVFVNPFLIKIIEQYKKEIVGIAIVKGSIIKKKSLIKTIDYFITLVLITGVFSIIKKIIEVLKFKILKINSISKVALKYNIPIFEINSINKKSFIVDIKKLEVDIIINQSQNILKKEILEIPKIGVINRHAALLPKYRGRLAPFWAYINSEKEIGISIHFVDEGIDSGLIIVQKRIEIKKRDSLNSLLKKIFELSPIAMYEAIEILRKDNYHEFLIENNNNEATYFSSPRFKDGIKYICKRLKNLF